MFKMHNTVRGVRRALRNSRKQGGFTLLELLVVVAILAAIAGTATIMLQDTDRKGMAAAHVAMMDELSKGIQTFRVLNSGKYPDNWDSLEYSVAGTDLVDGTIPAAGLLTPTLVSSFAAAPIALTQTQLDALNSVGIYQLRTLDPGVAGCADTAGATGIQAHILDKTNNVTAQNIFRSATDVDGNAIGCGHAGSATLGVGSHVVVWNPAQNNRVHAYSNGDPIPQGDGTTVAATGDDVLVAFGVGADSSLFNPAVIGALSNTPVYRHVANNEYNRFIVLFKIASAPETPANLAVNGQATFHAIVDGAGDTKDEELGEVDNTRPT